MIRHYCDDCGAERKRIGEGGPLVLLNEYYIPINMIADNTVGYQKIEFAKMELCLNCVVKYNDGLKNLIKQNKYYRKENLEFEKLDND